MLPSIRTNHFIVSSSWFSYGELVATGSCQNTPVFTKPEAGRRDNAGPAELNGSDLFADCVVHIGDGHDERDPEPAGSIDGRGSHGRSHQRQLAGTAPGPAIGNRVNQWIDLTSLDDSLVEQLPGCAVLAERRRTGHEHEIEAAVRIGDRNT